MSSKRKFDQIRNSKQNHIHNKQANQIDLNSKSKSDIFADKDTGPSVSSKSGNKKSKFRSSNKIKKEHEHLIKVFDQILTQTDTELSIMNHLLKEIQTRKERVGKKLCSFVSSKGINSLYKPRNIIKIDAPNRIIDNVIKSLQESQNIPSINARKKTIAIACIDCNRPIIKPFVNNEQITLSEDYNTELKKILEPIHGDEKEAKEKLEEIIKVDLTGYGYNKRGMILIMKYTYDFSIYNPLLLLASRLNFLKRESQIVQYIQEKRSNYRKESFERFSGYIKEYDEWLISCIKLNQSKSDRNGRRSLRKIDIYGREASNSKSPTPIKDNPELDSDLCMY